MLVDGIGKQTALVETDIAGRRPDQPGDRVPFHILRHVEAGQFDPHRMGKLARDLGLADTGWAGKQVATDRLVRLAQAGPGEFDGRRQRIDRVVLTEHDTLEIGIERLQRFLIRTRHAFGRDAGDLGDHRFDVLDGNQLLTPAFRHQFLRRSDLVDHVDCLIGQLAVVDIFGGKFHGRADRRCRVAHPVMLFIIGLEAAQNFHGILDAWLWHIDFLEPAHQRTVLLKIRPVFLIGGGTDASQQAALQRGFQQIRRIH